MANPIRRLIQLVLDRGAAKRAEGEAKKSISAIDAAVTRLKSTFLSVGAALGTVFGIHKLIEFGKRAVEEANRSERAWKALGNTVDNMGESFNAMEGDLRALGHAFQDITTHSDEDYAESLAKLILLTGDVSAATNNMGLVANVAAKFFGGELEPAVTLVGKTMNGILTPLQRLGIHAKSAQEALDILAQRTFGGAQGAARTFSGQMKQLNNIWGDFKEELGAVIVEGAEGSSILDLLKNGIKDLTRWVRDNKTELIAWVKEGIQAAIAAVRTLGETFTTFLQMLGKRSLTAGAPLAPLADTAAGLKRQLAVWSDQAKQLQAQIDDLIAKGDKLKAVRDSIVKIEPQAAHVPNPQLDALELQLRSLADELDTVGKNSDRAREKLANLAKGAKPPPTLFGGRPTVGKNVTTPESLAIEAARKEFEQAMRAAEASALLSSSFDLLGARASALEALMKALTANGVKPAAEELQNLGRQLEAIHDAQTVEELLSAMKALQEQMVNAPADFDRLSAEAAVLQSAMEKLTARFGPDDARVKALAARLRELGMEIPTAEFERGAAAARQMWEALGQRATNLSGVFETRIALMTDQATQLRAAMEAIPLSMRASSPAFKQYAAQYNQVQQAIQKTTIAQQLAAEVAHDVAGALTAAMKGQLGAYAAGKAEQNLLEAAELGVEAAASVIFSLGIATGPLLALAGEHLAIAAAWGALAAASGGGGRHTGGAGGGSAALSGARGASGGPSERAQPTAQEVHIHLIGPGFDALNPEVQRVVYGAEQRARERFGANARIHLHRGG